MFKKLSFGYLLEKNFNGCNSVLDIGCGRDSPLKDLNLQIYKVGLDFYPPYIKESKEKAIHNRYILHDIRERLPFPDNHFDSVIAIEVIEHLTKNNGLKLIKEMQRVAKKNIILTTPNGFLKGSSEDSPIEVNPAEKHISGWDVNELKNLGFKVKGLNGLRGLRGSEGEIKIKPKKFFKVISAFSRPITYIIPKLSFQLFFIRI